MTYHCIVFVDDVSISGYKATSNDPSAAERATEVQDGEDAQSPEAVSATSQSTDEQAKDLVLPSHALYSLSFMCVFAPPLPLALPPSLPFITIFYCFPISIKSLCVSICVCVCKCTTAGVCASPEGSICVFLSERER